MTTNAEYKAAKAWYDEHIATHKCKPKMLLREGDEPCETRLRLWRNVMAVARDLGKQ